MKNGQKDRSCWVTLLRPPAKSLPKVVTYAPMSLPCGLRFHIGEGLGEQILPFISGRR